MYRLLRFAFPKVGQEQSPPPMARLDRLDRGTGCVPIDPTASLFEPEHGNTNAWVIWATWGFLALGLVVRLVRFLVVYLLWPDEAFVAANFLRRLPRFTSATRLRPGLPGSFFLWIELTAVRLFGFSEWSLRLFLHGVRPGEHGAVSSRGRSTAARDSVAIGGRDFRATSFSANPP